MKVLLISRSTLFTVRGGDTTQIETTAVELKKLGIDADIRLAGSLDRIEGYDIVHFFNLIRPADMLRYTKHLSVPYVVSSIFVDYSKYDRTERRGTIGLLSRLFSRSQLEYFKTLGRAALGQDKLASPSYCLLGHRASMIKVARGAALILPNSENEASRLKAYLGMDFPYRVIYNGISPGLFYPLTGVKRHPRRVLCVGQIEGRKNQHRLIEATRAMDVELVIIGKHSPNNKGYYEHCRSIAHDRVQFIDFVPQAELNRWYNSAAVHALPSWFETTGLSTLEAAAAGCNIVVSDEGDTRDYFEGFASFCQADDTASIQRALEEALTAGSEKAETFRKVILEKYTWQHATAQTLEVYKSVLGS